MERSDLAFSAIGKLGSVPGFKPLAFNHSGVPLSPGTREESEMF